VSRPLTCEGKGGLVGGKGRNGGLGALLVGSRKRGRYFVSAMSSSRRVIPLLNAHTGHSAKSSYTATQASDFLFIHQRSYSSRV
jgi:hypothetical protein